MSLLLAGFLAACGSSPPSHYYVLSAVADPALPQPLGLARRTVALGQVRLPGALDRPQIAREIGPNQIEYAESDRWAGPLDAMARHVLAADLRPLLPPGTTLVATDSAAPADVIVAVEISRFDADKAGRVTLQANWETLNRNAKIVGAPRQANIVEPGRGSDSAAVAATMSRALALLAGNIAAGLGAAGSVAMR